MTLLSYLQAHDALWIGGLIAAVIGIYALAEWVSAPLPRRGVSCPPDAGAGNGLPLADVAGKGPRGTTEPQGMDFDKGWTAPRELPPVIVPFDQSAERRAFLRAQAAYRVVSRKVH